MKLKTIYYLNGTHWDREWYKSFQGFRYMLMDVLDEVIDTLEKDPDFQLYILDGQTAVLDDYLEISPQQRPRLEKLIRENRIAVGPWYTMPDEFLPSGESLIRNLLGVGSLMAFPGSMCGALLCGVAYKLCPKLPAAYAGEVFGTGILGGLASYPIAAVLMGNTKAALFTFVPSFLISTAVGAAISVLVLSALKRTHVFSSLEGALR